MAPHSRWLCRAADRRRTSRPTCHDHQCSGEPVSAVVTTVAAPSQPLPAGGDGFSIERTYYTLDGQEANVSEAKQNERYVVVLKATETNDWPSRVLITDLLPAGFEIDNPGLVNSAKPVEFRMDRRNRGGAYGVPQRSFRCRFRPARPATMAKSRWPMSCAP